jgi:hypothetical protein
MGRLAAMALVSALYVGVLTPGVLAASAVPQPLAAIDTWSMATIPLPSTDVAYDATRDVLLVTVPSSHASLGNSLVELDPETGALGRHVWVGSEPSRIALTDDGSAAFVSFAVASEVVRVDLTSFEVDDRIDLGFGELGRPVAAQDLDTLPGRNDAVVVALVQIGSSTGSGVRMYVDGARLPSTLEGFDAPDRVEATSSSTLFGYAFDFSAHVTVSAGVGGLSSTSAVGPIGDDNIDIEAALGRIYTTTGLIVDQVTYEALASVPVRGPVEVTPADGRLTVVDDDDDLVAVYDATTGAPIGSRVFAGLPDVTALTASGTGFATAGPGGVALLGPTISVGPFASPTPPTRMLHDLDQVVLPYVVNDMVHDDARGLLYVAVGSASTTDADHVVGLDPTSGAVLRRLFVGSDPSVVRISPDGDELFVGLRTTGRIATLDLEAFSIEGSFSLGSAGGSPYIAEDIEVRPGTDDELLVALMVTGSSPRHQGVALFRNGSRVEQPDPGRRRGNRIAVDGDAAYGINNETSGYDYFEMEVSDAGVQTTLEIRRLWDGSSDDITSIDGRLYSGSRVVDPSGPTLVGRLPFTGVVGYDPSLDRLLVGSYASRTLIHEVDRTTLRLLGTYDLDHMGTPLHVVSTGDGALSRVAVSTRVGASTRQLILLSQAPGRLHPVAPSRLADTRTGHGAPAGRVPGGGTIAVDVTGVGGVPPTGVEAVVVNLTSVGATTAGYLTAWATGLTKPGTSNLNFRAGQVVANQAIVPVGADGTISIANSAGATHVIADIQGWFGDGSEADGSRLNPLAPARLADSRSGLGVPAGRVGAGATVSLDVTGVGGIPATGASAVVVNVTAVGATASTHLTLWASGGSKPATSNVNVAAGQVVANQAIVPVGADGRISIANAAGGTHVIVDVQGWFGDAGALLRPVTPARLADSRTGVGVPTGTVPAGGTVTVDVTGVGGVPAAGALAVVVNLTVTGGTAASHLTAWPTGQAKPSTSNLNFAAGQVVANQAVIPVGADGTISISNAAGATHVVVDVQGWFGPAGPG